MTTIEMMQQELAQANADLLEQTRLTEQARRIAAKLEVESSDFDLQLEDLLDEVTSALNALPINWAEDKFFVGVREIHAAFDAAKGRK